MQFVRQNTAMCNVPLGTTIYNDHILLSIFDELSASIKYVRYTRLKIKEFTNYLYLIAPISKTFL